MVSHWHKIQPYPLNTPRLIPIKQIDLHEENMHQEHKVDGIV